VSDEFEVSVVEDADLQDAYSAEGEPDPETVGQRIQEVRVWLETSAERQLPGWDELEEEEQVNLTRIAAGWILAFQNHRDDPENTAVALHEVWEDYKRTPDWNSLDAEEQRVAALFAEHVGEWLRQEGSLSREGGE
jgi:hypothetical protein